MESIAGQIVSHYELLEKLGAGGMGQIYKARDVRLNRIVAVKVLTPGRTRDPERRRRFIQEARAASALNHPNIITIHDILPEGDTQYMVMEYVCGKTLQQLIATGRLPVAQVLQLSMQMANALAAAHAAGIIHRDFKPANVMVTAAGLVKILDFGLAKLMDPKARIESRASGSSPTVTLTAAPLTVEGAIMGTVNYMSPEQAEGLKVDARSDIFSFGAVLYEMITGRRAFAGDSSIATLSAVLRDEVRPIRAIAPEVPADLDGLIARCLRKNPAERWQSMDEVATALRRLTALLDAAPVPAPPSSRAPEVRVAAIKNSGKKGVLWLEGISVAMLALALAGGWWKMHHQGAVPPKPSAPIAVTAPPALQPARPELVPVKLDDGLPFRIALLDDVPIDAEVGHALRFRVLDDVQPGNVVAIAKGAIVTGTVAALAGKRNFFGARSKGRFRLISADSADDASIHVRATPAPSNDGNEARPFETSNSTRVKDKSLMAASGAEYVAYVAGEQTVNVRK